MVGNTTLVTTVPARTPAPPTAGTTRPSGVSAANVAPGNNASASGEDLPVRRPTAMPAHDIEDIVRRLNELMAERERSLSFHVDQASGRTVITVVDATTHEVVRQIPSEEALVLARAVEKAGALLDARI